MAEHVIFSYQGVDREIVCEVHFFITIASIFSNIFNILFFVESLARYSVSYREEISFSRFSEDLQKKISRNFSPAIPFCDAL